MDFISLENSHFTTQRCVNSQSNYSIGLKNIKSSKVSIWLCVVDTKLSAQRREKWSKMEVKWRQLHWTTFLVELFNSAHLAFIKVTPQHCFK